jgi:hypothetical protein
MSAQHEQARITKTARYRIELENTPGATDYVFCLLSYVFLVFGLLGLFAAP